MLCGSIYATILSIIMRIIFIVVFFFKVILNSNVVIDKSKKSYLEKLNKSVHTDKSLHVKKDEPNTKGPFHIKLEVGENVFYGSAHSIQAAKHHAASNAIDYLFENKDKLFTECLDEGKMQLYQLYGKLFNKVVRFLGTINFFLYSSSYCLALILSIFINNKRCFSLFNLTQF